LKAAAALVVDCYHRVVVIVLADCTPNAAVGFTYSIDAFLME